MSWERADKISAGALVVACLALGLQAAPTVRGWLWPEASCDDASGLTRVEDVRAEASTSLAPQGSFDYEAVNVTDGNLNTAWIPAGSDGGEGSQLTLMLPEPTDVQLLCIVNGYVQDTDVYNDNGRVRDVTVATDAGTATGALTDMPVDERGTYQGVPLEEGRTETITITINTYFAGVVTAGQGARDTAISEIIVYEEGD